MDLNSAKQSPYTLSVLYDFRSSHLAFTVYSIDKCDWHLSDFVVELSCANNHLHLENISLGDSCLDQLQQDILLVQATCPRKKKGNKL